MGEDSENIFHFIQKHVVKITSRMVWATRTEVGDDQSSQQKEQSSKERLVMSREEILAKLQSKQEEVVFDKASGLDKEGVKFLAEELSKAENSHVTSLQISQCTVAPDGRKHLGEMLEKNVWLRKLCLVELFGLEDEWTVSCLSLWEVSLQ